MAQVIIRNLDSATVEALRARAKANGRSLEAELRLILREAANRNALAGEGAQAYIIPPPATTSGIQWGPKRPKFKPFEPIKIDGPPASETLIEDREMRF